MDFVRREGHSNSPSDRAMGDRAMGDRAILRRVDREMGWLSFIPCYF